MVAGHLTEKKGLYYVVLNYKDVYDNRKSKWLPTGISVRGNNKRAADKLLQEARVNFTLPQTIEDIARKSEKILFSDFMCSWLDMERPNLEATTYSAYYGNIHTNIVPYFKKRNIMLQDTKPGDIQGFYIFLSKERGVGANTIIRHHANIRKALQYALRIDLINQNPADKVQRPKVHKFIGGYYDIEELNKLFEVVKGKQIEFAVIMAAFYGLRRSEIIGLRWSAIDFANKAISIGHTVTEAYLDGKCTIIAKDRPKTTASFRSLPLIPDVENMLLRIKAEQEEFNILCGKSYNKIYEEYIYLDKLGERVKPGFVSENFKRMLSNNNLRHIRFHDLRHSCASLLLANGVSMKGIQEWLGHGNFLTTANTYAHLDFKSKLSSANAIMNSGLKLNQ